MYTHFFFAILPFLFGWQFFFACLSTFFFICTIAAFTRYVWCITLYAHIKWKRKRMRKGKRRYTGAYTCDIPVEWNCYTENKINQKWDKKKKKTGGPNFLQHKVKQSPRTMCYEILCNICEIWAHRVVQRSSAFCSVLLRSLLRGKAYHITAKHVYINPSWQCRQVCKIYTPSEVCA